MSPTVGDILRDNRDGDKWNEVTGKVGLNYHVNDDVMFYASYSRGYKAGGYNTDQEETYDPEAIDAYEVGMKSHWLGDRVQMNVAAFYYDYSDKQEFQRFFENGFSNFKILNAAKATSKGIELELQAHLTDALFIDGSFAYLEAEYDDFVTIDNTFPTEDPDRSGNTLPLAPEWKFNIGVQYDWMLGGDRGNLSIRGDHIWVDDQFGNAFNRDSRGGMLVGDGDLIPSYHTTNARLRWESNNAAWAAELYVKNLTDEYITSSTFVASAAQVFVGQMPPRTYGLRLSYMF